MAGKVFTTTVSINGEIDASVQKAFTRMADNLGRIQRAAIQSAGATDRLTATIDQQSDELEKAKRAYTDYILSGEKSRKKARELASNIKKLAQELDDNEDKLLEANAAAEKLAGGFKKAEKAADGAGGGFTVMKGVVADLVANGITKIAETCLDAAKSLAGLAENTREYREDMSKLETSFETLGHTAEHGTAVYKELYSVFGEEDRAVEAAQQIAALSKNQNEMARMVDIATGAWARWGDSLATESLMEAMNSTAKIGAVQGTLADALEWSGVNLDNFNANLESMNSEGQRSAYILKTLEKLYGKAADDYRSNNASIIAARKANSDYTDTVAEMGEIIEPITTKVQEGFTLILQKVIDLVTNGDITAFGKKVDNSFGSFVDKILPKIVGAIDWMGNNTGLIKGIAIAIGTVTAAMGALNVALTVQTAIMMAHPATWVVLGIVAAIGVLIGIITICIEYWHEIQDVAWSAAWAIAGVWKSFPGWFNNNVIQPIAGFFTGLWDGISNKIDEFINFFVTAFGSLAGMVKGPINSVIEIVNGAISRINSVGFDVPDWVPSIGGQKFALNIPNIPMLAAGGFTDGVSIAGEKAIEAVISFDPMYREENLSYWAQAGRMLGADFSDFALGGDSGSVSIDFGGITFAPNITVQGHADKSSIMEAIEEEYPEFIDMIEEYLVERGLLAYA